MYNLNGAIHIFQMVGDPDCHFDSQSIVLDQVEASSESEASVGQIPKVHRQEVRLLIKIWIYSKMHENYKKKCNIRFTVTKSIFSAHCC